MEKKIFVDDNYLLNRKKRKKNKAQEFGDKNNKINSEEKFPGELSDDDAYAIEKQQSDMEKRRKKLKRS